MKIDFSVASPTSSVSAPSVAAPEARTRAAAPVPTGVVFPAASGPATPPRQPTQRELRQAVDELQRKAQSFSPNLRFSVDHDTGRTVVRVTDANTQEVIRQIPAEEVLQLAKELDRMQGLLFHKEA